MKQRLKIMQVIILACGFLFLVFSSYALAEKIGYVDLSRLFNEYKKTSDYEKDLEEKAEKAGVYEKEKEIENLRNQLSLLSEKEKSKKEEEIKNKFEDLRKINLELAKDRDEKMKEILKDIEEAIKVYAKNNGFSLVLNDRVLVYQDKSLDLTDKVLEILKKNYKE